MTQIQPSFPAKDVVLFLGLTTIIVIPIIYFDILPLHDLPSHMARLAVIQSNGDDPVLSQYYVLNWHIVPNLALDIWAYLTAPFLNIEMTIRSFIIVSFLLMTGGTIFVHRSLGGVGLWPYISFLFIWNEILVWGFLSFLFSIGAALWLFGFWIKYRNRNIAVRVALHAVAAIGLFICHLFGFAVYTLAVGAYEAGQVILKWRASGVRMPGWEFFGGALQFAPALFLLIISQTSSGVSVVKFGSLTSKILNYSTPVLYYAPRVQLVVVALFVAFIVLSIWTKKAHIPTPCWFIIAIGAVCTLAAPSMMFNSFYLSHRMPVAFSFLFLALIQFPELDRLKNRIFRTGLVAVVAAHTMFISWYWADYQPVFQNLFTVTQSVQEGDTVLSMTMNTEQVIGNLRPPLIRAVEYLVPTKKIFSPHILLDDWHQPVRLTEHAQALKKLASKPGYSPRPAYHHKITSTFQNTVFHEFDFILTIRMDAFENQIPKNWVLQDRAGLFRLYRPGVGNAGQSN